MKEYNTINEAWFNVCQDAIKNGYKQKVQRGSFEGYEENGVKYEGEERSQLEALAFIIKQPEKRPLAVEYKGQMISTDKQIEIYFKEYIFNGEKAENEEYSYGERIYKFIPDLISMLIDTPLTNQSTIEIAVPKDIRLTSPPCCRVISWKLVNNKLNLACYFRSWDLAQGLPNNLGGLQLLNELIAGSTGHATGKLICFTDGGHVYRSSYPLFE